MRSSKGRKSKRHRHCCRHLPTGCSCASCLEDKLKKIRTKAKTEEQDMKDIYLRHLIGKSSTEHCSQPPPPPMFPPPLLHKEDIQALKSLMPVTLLTAGICVALAVLSIAIS